MKKLFCSVLAFVMLCGLMTGCQKKESSNPVSQTQEPEVTTQTLVGITFEIPTQWAVKSDQRENEEPSIAFTIDEHTEILFSHSSAFNKAEDRRNVIAAAPDTFANYEHLGTTQVAGQTAEHMRYSVVFDSGIFSMEEYTFAATDTGVYCIDIKRDQDSAFKEDDATITAMLASITFTISGGIDTDVVYAAIEPELLDLLKEIGAMGKPENITSEIIMESEEHGTVIFEFSIDGKDVTAMCISLDDKKTKWGIGTIYSTIEPSHYYWMVGSMETVDVYDFQTEKLISPATKSAEEALDELLGE